jgi:nucleosome binding factor SPN SPT16 subunit
MAGGRVLNTKTRGGNRQQPEQTTGEKIKENQRRLHAERAKAGMKKYENGNASNGDGAEKAVKKFESYRREEQLPMWMRLDNRLFCPFMDMRFHSIFRPSRMSPRPMQRIIWS